MKKFLVIGNNTSKSLSPIIFNYWFKKYKIKAKYSFLEVNKKSFDKQLKLIFKNKDVAGLNITIPYKQKIIKYLDSLDKDSKKINAVNCVSIGSKIRGINTDWEGYYKTIPMKNRRKQMTVLMFGYGGAALAIHYVLKTKGYKNIIILNRSKKRIQFGKNKKK